MPAVARRVRGVPLGMSRIYSQCPDSEAPDRLVDVDVVLRQEPDEEEDDEDEDDDNEDEDDDDRYDDYGYSV